MKEETKSSLSRKIWGLIRPLLIAVVLGLLINFFVVQRNTVVGNSMLPTLESNDSIIVEKISRWFDSGIQRGDIITIDLHEVINGEKTRVIKRVVGLPGETVDIHDGHVYINDQLLIEDYLFNEEFTGDLPGANIHHLTLTEDEYFVLGDNRGRSRDSRQFGAVKREDILGKMWFRILPLSKFGKP